MKVRVPVQTDMRSIYTWALAFGGLASTTDAFAPSAGLAMRPKATSAVAARATPAVATAASSIHAPGCPCGNCNSGCACGACGTANCRTRNAQSSAAALDLLTQPLGLRGHTAA